MKKCNHERFLAAVEVNRIEDKGRFTCDVRIKCEDCGAHVRFLLEVRRVLITAFGTPR